MPDQTNSAIKEWANQPTQAPQLTASQWWNDPGPQSTAQWLNNLTSSATHTPTFMDYAYPFTAPAKAAYGAAQSGLGGLAQRATQPPNARSLMQAVMPGWQLLPHLQNIQPSGIDLSGVGHQDLVGHFHSLLQEMHRRGLFSG